jgi:hypothetical protein
VGLYAALKRRSSTVLSGARALIFHTPALLFQNDVVRLRF